MSDKQETHQEDTYPWGDGTLYQDEQGTYDTNGTLIEEDNSNEESQ